MGYLTQSRAFDPRENNEEPDEVREQMVATKKKEYYSDIIGDYIVDAKTGAKYPWKVGSLDEQRFFRVTNTVPIQNFERKGTYNSYSNRSSGKAFYETPHAYMNHCNVDLDDDYVKLWYNKVNKLYPLKN